MQKEELAVLILLAFAAVAAGALAIAAAGAPGAPYTVSSKAGDTVYLEGLLLHKEKTRSGGHLLLTVKSGTELAVVFVRAASGAFDAADSARPGNTLFVEGKVQVYQGQREIAAARITVE